MKVNEVNDREEQARMKNIDLPSLIPRDRSKPYDAERCRQAGENHEESALVGLPNAQGYEEDQPCGEGEKNRESRSGNPIMTLGSQP